MIDRLHNFDVEPGNTRLWKKPIFGALACAREDAAVTTSPAEGREELIDEHPYERSGTAST
jgi:hypothetical protein